MVHLTGLTAFPKEDCLTGRHRNNSPLNGHPIVQGAISLPAGGYSGSPQGLSPCHREAPQPPSPVSYPLSWPSPRVTSPYATAPWLLVLTSDIPLPKTFKLCLLRLSIPGELVFLRVFKSSDSHQAYFSTDLKIAKSILLLSWTPEF